MSSGGQQERHRIVREGGRGRSQARPRLGRTGRRTPKLDELSARTRRRCGNGARRRAPRRRDRSGRRHGPRDARLRLAMQGNFAPAKRNSIRPCGSIPETPSILAHYSAWPSTFGHPERGAEAADRAIRLNPNYLLWQAWNFSAAYFGAGQFEDALRILERLPKDNYQLLLLGQSSPRAMPRSAEFREAKAAVSDTLANTSRT